MKNLKDLNLSNYCLTKDGKVYSLFVNRFMKNAKVHGYPFVSLVNDFGEKRNFTIHRLLALTFIPRVEGKDYVNHIDGNKENNSLKNLEWVTCAENNQHANDSGLRNPTFLTDDNLIPLDEDIIHDWKKLGSKEFTEELVYKICELLQEGYRVCDVSAMTGFERRYIQHLRDRDKFSQWFYIVDKFDFSKIKRKMKTSVDKVIEICKLLESGMYPAQVVKELNVDRKLVENIKNRKFHKSISQSFDF